MKKYILVERVQAGVIEAEDVQVAAPKALPAKEKKDYPIWPVVVGVPVGILLELFGLIPVLIGAIILGVLVGCAWLGFYVFYGVGAFLDNEIDKRNKR